MDQHVPLDEFKQNVRAIVTHPRVLAHEGIRIILITAPGENAPQCERVMSSWLVTRLMMVISSRRTQDSG